MLRHEWATLLGYPNYMTFRMSIENAMLGNPDEVQSLLTGFRKRIARIGTFEHEAESKCQDQLAEDKTLYLWDEPYYKRIWIEKQYSVDRQEISKYFPRQPTAIKMLEIFGDLFGLVFEKCEGDVWHDNVMLFSVWELGDRTSVGDFTGYLYLDVIPRAGKYKGTGK